MRFDVLTLLPEFFSSPLQCGVTGRAVSKGLLKVCIHNIREFTTDRHRTADDAPYGGGSGMVMKVEPVKRAIDHVKVGNGSRGPDNGRPTVVLTTPQGEPFTHKAAVELAGKGWVIIVCGRYEGVDERIRTLVDREFSVGDFILTGGEIPALA
jgi:tRNA (guanine37-N1)-methyltransferase